MNRTTRHGFTKSHDHKILDIRISKEPLSPVVREGDDQWADVARWTLFLLIALEENSITREDFLSGKTNVQISPNLSDNQLSFLKRIEDASSQLGLDKHWGNRIARTTGSYADIFARNLGELSQLNMQRGINRLWVDGGLLYSPPFQ